MKTFRYAKLRFEITVPDCFSQPNIFNRIISSSNPELLGPNGASIKITARPYKQPYNPEDHLSAVQKKAESKGYDVLRTRSIEAGGRSHIAIVYDDPLDSPPYMIAPDRGNRYKVYHLVFEDIEYIVTARVATIVRGDLVIHGGELNYDDIVTTFRRL